VIEYKVTMFKSLYVWIIAYNISHFSNILEFLDVIFSLIGCFFCILPIYLSKIKLLMKKISMCFLKIFPSKVF
jgi:hypothetical protein